MSAPRAKAKPKAGDLSEEEDLAAYDDDDDMADGEAVTGTSGGKMDVVGQEATAASKTKKKAVQQIVPVYQASMNDVSSVWKRIALECR